MLTLTNKYDLYGNELSKKDDNEFTVTNTIDENGNIIKTSNYNYNENYEDQDLTNNEINQYQTYENYFQYFLLFF